MHPQKSSPHMIAPPIRTKTNKKTIFHEDLQIQEPRSFRVVNNNDSYADFRKEYNVKNSLYDQYMGVVSTIRHHTPPFVNLDGESLTYDPISKSYLIPAEIS